MIRKQLVKYFEESIRNNWHLQALSDFKGQTYTYGEVAQQISLLHNLFKHIGIQQGDKIAIVGRNSARWGIVYLAAVTYGAIIVPILPDFKPNDLYKIINHSESKILFLEENIFTRLDVNELPLILLVIHIADFSIISSQSEEIKRKAQHVLDKPDFEIKLEDFNLPDIENDRLAVLSYTSGTTGNPKGVMITHNNLAANIQFAQQNMPLRSGDAIVSFLPLAHTYGCSFEFLFPFTLGCHITILTKTPSPQIVLQAFSEIKPALILSVPLIVEKIFKKQILPVIDKFYVKVLLYIPLVNLILYRKIRNKLNEAFGNNFKEVIIGGAPFNSEAEKFLKKIKFRFTVGYGMTECAPLISYAPWKKHKLGAAGKPVDTLEVRILSKNPSKVSGEIILKGENLMAGYYKNEEATKAVIDEQGWFHTGDLGIIDKQGFIHIKGRSKNMILGANGKNIYPEEIEALLNNYFGVSESLVISKNGKLVALIYPDFDAIEKSHPPIEDINKLFQHHIKDLNHRLPAYMNISDFIIYQTEFEKTPKRSIKRYLYEKQFSE